jgi:glycosyltransferase involved in cell wall biosynthesis
MRVALVHDWLMSMRGGERCLEALCELFPEADLFTLLHSRGKVSPTIERMRIHTSFVQYLPFAERYYRHYLPVFPLAIERFDLAGYDLVLSSSHCVAKGAIRSPHALHISYTYTPMRYAWDLYDEYFKDRVSGPKDRLLRMVMARLRAWDTKACSRVDRFIAISHHVADRIKRHYHEEAEVIYPPVDLNRFRVSDGDDGYYLVVSALAPYKRIDLAIEACARMKRPLKIIGTGQDEERLRRKGGPMVEWLGWQPDEVIAAYYRSCRALLFPGEEDFGIVPLEAMASGKPVIAFARGGALETVVPLNPAGPSAKISQPWGFPLSVNDNTPTGVFFYQQTTESMIEAINLFERNEQHFDPRAIRSHVEPFDRVHFKTQIRQLIEMTFPDLPRAAYAKTPLSVS